MQRPTRAAHASVTTAIHTTSLDCVIRILTSVFLIHTMVIKGVVAGPIKNALIPCGGRIVTMVDWNAYADRVSTIRTQT
ncbi:hypothetical protein DPMN_133251 [Dreissena polymorpha]|uniref:Uncharacterized protein n=1 Tax=Dreissena polymorpha TaxID=45954 RepID=A0A9D4FWM5_DREPO|nr:hypothetical protein DPMN_133251 [Dreissena polymorpha]